MRRDKLEEMVNETTVDPSEAFKLLDTGEDDSPNHGDVVEADDGVAELVVDRRHESDKILQRDERAQRLIKLADRQDTTFEHMRLKSDDTVDRGMMVIKKNPMSPDALHIREVKNEFAGFEIGPNGLVPKGSDEAKKFQILMNAVRTGQVVLPTVEEYEEQKKALAEQNNQEMTIQEETDMNGLPVNGNGNNTSPASNPVNQPAAQGATKLPVNPAKVPEGAPVRKAAPINLAQMQRERQKQAQPKQENVPETPQQAEAQKVPEPQQTVTQFNVPSDKAETFYSTLTVDQKEKVSHSDQIIINEVKEVDIPTAVRSIDDLAEYKRVVPRAVSGEFVELPLPNSGYIATVYGCAALEMSSIMVDSQMDTVDYAKRYQFCFDRLQTTSVGGMSYQEFIRYTSPRDLSGLVWAIYRASVGPDEEEVLTLRCGNEGCNNSYDVKFKLDDLIDYDSLSEGTVEQINNIISARDDLDAATAIRKSAPASQVKFYKIGDRTWGIKAPDGPMIISRTPQIQRLTEKYMSPLIPILILYVREIYIPLDLENNGRVQDYKVTNLDIIAEEIVKLSNENLKQLTQIVNNTTEYDPYQFKLKGPIRCPKCGREETNLAIDIDDLVFQRVARAMSTD